MDRTTRANDVCSGALVTGHVRNLKRPGSRYSVGKTGDAGVRLENSPNLPIHGVAPA